MHELKQVHAILIKTAQIHDPVLAIELLRHCATSDFHDIDYAPSVFDQMHEPNCFAWNTLVRALAKTNDRPLQALLLFYKMVFDGMVEPNRFTFRSVLKACSVLARLEERKQVHGLVMKFGVSGDEFVVSNLLRMYVMCKDKKDAHVFIHKSVDGVDNKKRVVKDKRRERGNVVLCNVMVDGYMRVGNLKALRVLFDRMHQRNVVS